ncbi:Predicted arabinose efflux permease, MFS family [Bosea sp. CRIB-10]|nr:Predicted arabinose efflux permease, MFS family [Bosea sp. CRIB-10]
MRGIGVALLFLGALLTATGYGATFLLTEHFRNLGGSEIETGRVLAGAMVGTFVGVPLIGWVGARFGGARLAAIGSVLVAAGYLLLAGITSLSSAIVIAGFMVGCGWGMFYLAAPIAVSERVSDLDRGFWFTRFGAFQMAGIGGGPALALLFVNMFGLSTTSLFRLLALACLCAAACLWAFELTTPRPARTLAAGTRASKDWVRSIIPLAGTRAIYPILMVGTGACVFTGMLTFQSSLVRDSGLDASLYFTTYALVVVVARFTLAPAINRADGNRMSVLLLILMSAGVLTYFAIGYGAPVQVVSGILLGLGYGLVYTVIQTQVVNDAPDAHRTGALTWFVMSYFVGIFGFPAIGGWLIVHWGTQAFLAVVLACALIELALALVRNRSRASNDDAALTAPRP